MRHPFRFDDYVDAFFILLDYRQRATGRLQDRRQFRFDKSFLFVRVAHMAKRWSHIQSSADVAFGQNIVAAQMHLGGLSGSLQLLQMTITKFVLFVSLVADSLRVGDALGDRRRRT